MIITHRISQYTEKIVRGDELEKLKDKAVSVTSIWEGTEIKGLTLNPKLPFLN